MKAIKIGTNRLISVVLSIVMCATILTGAIWALSNLFKTGMSIVVTYDAPVNAKVYLSTDSTGAGTLRQPSSDNIVTVGNFNKANSAIIFNMHDNDNDGAQSKTNFEALGTGDKSLICDANGEMQFYVFVENFSETESVYYRADITFGNTGETTPFSEAENPRYAVSEAVSDSTGGGVTSSLLAFKIKANDPSAGINSDQIIIKIELRTTLTYLWLVTGPYAGGDYAGLYHIDFGEYPQSQETNSTIISAMSTTVDSKGYYTSSANGRKYARKGTSPNFTYYLVEPVRWLIIGNGSGLNGMGFPDKNGNGGADLASNQLLLLSEKCIGEQRAYYTPNIQGTIYWKSSHLYLSLPNLKNNIFKTPEQSFLDTFNHDDSQLSILSYDMAYKYDYYCSTDQLKSLVTPFIYTGNPCWSLALQQTIKHSKNWALITSIDCELGTLSNYNVYVEHTKYVRPIIILNV